MLSPAVFGLSRSEPSPDELKADLAAILKDDLSVYFSLGPEGAVLSVRGPTVVAFGRSFDARWKKMTPQGRARAVATWIRRAADYCRNPRVRMPVPHDTVA